MNKCTRCWNDKKIEYYREYFWMNISYKISLCADCIIAIFPSIVGHIEGTDYRIFLQKYGKQKERKQMPKAFKLMEKAMKKQYGAKRGVKIASMTWNKKHKGTGQTVGRGRK